MKKSLIKRLKNKWVITGFVLLIILILILVSRGSNSTALQIAEVKLGDVIEKVDVTGTISPLDKANLAFQKGGVVSRIYVKVGDKVRAGQILASLESAGDIANLAMAEATYADTARKLRPEELAVQITALDNAKKDAINAAREGYVKAQTAVFNYTDTVFSNPQTVNPTISIRTQSINEERNINEKRISVSETFQKWANDLNNQNKDNATVLITNSRNYLNTIKVFIDNLSIITSNLSPGNSGLTQAVVDTHVSNVNSALTTLNTAITSVTVAETALSTAQSNYDLKLAGNSSESIAAQMAKVDQAVAELTKDSIISPINGIVIKSDPNVGEFVSAGQSAFAVQNSQYKIEAFVSESDIAKIKMGNLASSTLDAYGSDIDFPAQVTMINPAETVLEGVPTYKVTLKFLNIDERIRSGMTANLEIITNAKHNIFLIPFRALVQEDGKKIVRVVKADGKTFTSVPVEVGLKGSDGTIEIISGLGEGEKVVTYVK